MADSATNKHKLQIVCPLKFERDLLLRHGVADIADVDVCGMGAIAARHWVDALSVAEERLVVLVGIAGGLSSIARPGSAFLVREVRSAGTTGETFTTASATLANSAVATHASAVACMADQPISTADDKRELHERTGADLVDMESLAFAAAATARGLKWMIVRGVSDGPEDLFPAEVVHFIDEKGRTRYGTAVKHIMLRPSLLPALLQLRRVSDQAMREASAIVRDVYEAQRE